MFRIKTIKKNIRPWHIMLAIGVAALALILFGLINEVINHYNISQRISDLEQQANQLQRENSQLDNLINTWENSGQLEKVARLKLGLEKPGEKAVLIVRQPSATEPGNSGNDVYIKPDQEVVGKVILSDSLNNNKTANPIKWWRYFFH